MEEYQKVMRSAKAREYKILQRQFRTQDGAFDEEAAAVAYQQLATDQQIVAEYAKPWEKALINLQYQVRGFVGSLTGNKSFEQISHEVRTGKAWDRGAVSVQEQEDRAAGAVPNYARRVDAYGSQQTPAGQTSSPGILPRQDTIQQAPPVRQQMPERGPVTPEVTQIGDREFLLTSNKMLDFGVVTEDVGGNRPIRYESQSREHVLRHFKEIQEEGYSNDIEFIEDVSQNHTAIYSGKGNTLILAKKNGKAKVAYIELVPDESNQYYRINSALVSRENYFKNKKPLWERAQSSQAEAVASNPPSAVTGQSGFHTGQSIPQGSREVNSPSETSKVVDENGEPLEVSHGTAAEFHTFEEGYGKSFKRRGIFFTDNDNVSEAFSASDKAIKKAYLNIRNPLIIDANGKHWTELEFEGKKIDSDDLAGIARERGYDGVIIRDVADPYPLRGNTYIALSPTQIKYSAETTYDNQGNVIPQERRYDPNEPDSRYAVSRAGAVTRAAKATLAGKDKTGRPDLANPGLTEEARRGVRNADQYTYNYPEAKRDEDTLVEAANLDSLQVAEKILAGRGLSDAETLRGQELVTEAFINALNTGKIDDMRTAVRMAHGWRMGGRELARAMRLRRDLLRTPAERFEAALGAAFLLPPKQMGKRIEAITRELSQDITARKRKSLEAEMDSLIQKLAVMNAKLRLQLARRGVIISQLKQQLENAKTEREKRKSEDDAKDVIGDILAARGGLRDALYEYWISSLLSGPQTQVVNVTSNILHGIWELGPQRLMEAMVNSFASKEEAAQWGEFKYMLAAFIPGMQRAWRNMLRSWKTERPTFMEELSGAKAGSTIGLTSEHRGGAMDRYTGKRLAKKLRIPLRGLLALDEFTKSLAGQMEAAAHAYRAGKAHGLQGSELESYITTQVADLASSAWEAGLNSALRIAFQTPLSKGAEAASQWIGNTPFKWVIPFRRTPANIFKTGIRKTPLGTASLAKNWSVLNGDDKVRLLSEQMIGWAVAGALAAAIIGGDDDDEPWITGSIPYNSTKPGERLLKQRTIPAQSIRLGGRYYSYSRIEPFATTLQGLVDATNAIREYQEGKPIKDVILDLFSKSLEAATDKTFMRGLGDLYDAMQMPESKLTSYAVNFATSWAPNIVKQVARATDPVYREQSLGKGGDYFNRLEDRVIYRIIPKGVLPPKRTPWGEESRKSEGLSTSTDFLFRLLSPIAETTPAGRDPRAIQLDRLLTNWNNRNWDDIWAPELPDRYIGSGENRIDLTDDEYDQYIKQSGEIALERLEAYSLNYEEPTKRDLLIIKKTLEFGRAAARNTIRGQRLATP